MCIFVFSLGSLHQEEDMPELACWRDVRGTWSGARSSQLRSPSLSQVTANLAAGSGCLNKLCEDQSELIQSCRIS